VKELPEFRAFAEAHKTEKVQVIYVSLDFKNDIKEKLEPLSIKAFLTFFLNNQSKIKQ
jgi:hypothetical protein